MAKANGKVARVLSATSMKVIMQMIRSMASVSSTGLVVIRTKENIRMMKEMALEK